MTTEEEIVANWGRYTIPSGPFAYQNSMVKLRNQCAQVIESWMLRPSRNLVNPWVAAADEVVDMIIAEATTDPIFQEIRRQQNRLHSAVSTLQDVTNTRVAIEGLVADAEAWVPEKFANRIEINGSHYVYFLYRIAERNPVYIGETSSVFRRIGQHISDGTKDFDEVAILQYRNKDAAKECEKQLIAKLQPEYNIKGTRKPYAKKTA